MANAKSLAQKRIGDLIRILEESRAEALPTGTSPIGQVTVWRFTMSALQAVRAICGESSPHYVELHEAIQEYKHSNVLNTDRWMGILQAVADDLQSGMLSSVRELIAAEVFADLGEMAEYLLDSGYHLPATAIAGAVLEDALRKICQRSSVTWDGDSSITKLNMVLYKANVYDKPQFGQVDAWGKLRNKVDHGDFSNADEIDPNDVRRFIWGLRDFIVRYLT